jgi:DNA-binding winged helix-turn-helix (wHTH) protein
VRPAAARFKFVFGPFAFDQTTGQLLKGGARLNLQDQPRTILDLLLMRAGEVVTREEMREALWGKTVHTDFNKGINTAVGRLRQLLCDSGARPLYIERVAGQGYRFIAPVNKELIGGDALPPSDVPSEDPRSRQEEIKSEPGVGPENSFFGASGCFLVRAGRGFFVRALFPPGATDGGANYSTYQRWKYEAALACSNRRATLLWRKREWRVGLVSTSG